MQTLQKDILLGGGCFWCIEALYKKLPGVIQTESGYAGGKSSSPDYQSVCKGQTGHAEVIRIVYDPQTITLNSLIDFFWKAHNPTTLNRQGADIGTQYRSVIFYADQEERQSILESRTRAQSMFDDEIVTEILPRTNFYRAEEVHQNYYEENPNHPYCMMVIAPKFKHLNLEQTKRN